MTCRINKKTEALFKTLKGVDKVAVIHVGDEVGGVSTVAFVECPSTMTVKEKLEFAFMKTNSIDDAWWNNKEVTKMFGGDGCRSTSVGDMILIGTKKYKCEMTGWSEI